MASETFGHFEKFYNLGGKCGCFKTCYKINLVCTGMWVQEHGMHREVTRPT